MFCNATRCRRRLYPRPKGRGLTRQYDNPVNQELQSAIYNAAREAGEGNMTLAELAEKFGALSVERFHVDLVRGETTVYQGNYVAVLPAYAPAQRPAPEFSAADIDIALIGTEDGACAYPTFCELVLAAGCVGFMVFIVGQRTLYYGEAGEVLSKANPEGASPQPD